MGTFDKGDGNEDRFKDVVVKMPELCFEVMIEMRENMEGEIKRLYEKTKSKADREVD